MAAAITTGPQNKAAVEGQSVQLVCKTDHETCENLIWARTDENGASVILHVSNKMTQVAYRWTLFIYSYMLIWLEFASHYLLHVCIFKRSD